jgi:hypothetical protein
MAPPDHLAPIIDAVIEHALRGAPVPEQLPTLIEWYENGWESDYIMQASVDHGFIALHLSSFDLDLCDDEVRAQLNPPAPLLDSHRTQFARDRIAEIFENESDYAEKLPSIHSVQLENSHGEQAMLGWLAFLQGQGGCVPEYQGIFRNMDAFFDFLRQSDYVLMIDGREPERVTDETILRLWSYDT